MDDKNIIKDERNIIIALVLACVALTMLCVTIANRPAEPCELTPKSILALMDEAGCMSLRKESDNMGIVLVCEPTPFRIHNLSRELGIKEE